MALNLLSSAKWYLFNFDTPFDSVKTVVLWFTLLVVVVFSVLFACLKGDGRKKLSKIAILFTVCYACLLSITFLAFTFSENQKEGTLITLLLIPLAVLIISIGVFATILIFSKNKTARVFSGAIAIAAFVTTLVCMGIHFLSGDGAEMNYINNKDINSVALYIFAALLTAAVIAAAFIFDKGYKGFDTKSVTYAGVCIAMSFALSYLRIVKLPQGGSITVASLLPLMLYSYVFGTKKGVFAGTVYGLLQAIQDPYILHPAQFLLDYPLAFGCIGLAGIFANSRTLEKIPQLQFALGALVAGLGRLLMHFLSGAFAFAAFADGQNPFVYSIVYQIGYVLPDLAIVIVFGVLIFSSPSFVKFVRSKMTVSPEPAK